MAKLLPIVCSVLAAVAVGPPREAKEKAPMPGGEPRLEFYIPPRITVAMPTGPKAALVLVRFQGGQCTGTICGERLDSGGWHVLCAAHCLQLRQKATLKLSDGRVIYATAVARDQKADLVWLETDLKTLEALPSAKLAKSTPARGTRMWHSGFGIDNPGNKEEGQVLSGPDRNGQCAYWLSVSPGDSGGGMFREDNGDLIGAVCCTQVLSRPSYVWAGGPLAAWRLKPGAKPRDVAVRFEAALSEIPPRPTLAIHPTLHVCDCDE